MDDVPPGVVARGFRLLGCFDEEHATLTLSELSRRSSIPVNTTLRIARSLLEVGALERGPDGRFSIGLRMYELAALAPRGVGLREAALPYLHDLHALTGHHALLSVREHDEAVLIERVSPRGRSRDIEYRVGGRMPLTSTGAGLVLLAFAPRELQEAACGSFNEAAAIDEISTGRDLRIFLSAVRRSGAAVGRRDRPRPLVTAAVPVRDARAVVVAALSVVLPADGLNPQLVIPALTACARAVGQSASSAARP
jgi:DNA-binding IclR family transcriptional regulator